jgi:hypothetical protein
MAVEAGVVEDRSSSETTQNLWNLIRNDITLLARSTFVAMTCPSTAKPANITKTFF